MRPHYGRYRVTDACAAGGINVLYGKPRAIGSVLWVSRRMARRYTETGRLDFIGGDRQPTDVLVAGGRLHFRRSRPEFGDCRDP